MADWQSGVGPEKNNNKPYKHEKLSLQEVVDAVVDSPDESSDEEFGKISYRINLATGWHNKCAVNYCQKYGKHICENCFKDFHMKSKIWKSHFW